MGSASLLHPIVFGSLVGTLAGSCEFRFAALVTGWHRLARCRCQSAGYWMARRTRR
jgi:hypothetical protein